MGKFIEEFFMTYDRYNAKGIRYIEIGKFRLGKQAELQRFLNKYCVQRKRIEVMPWLPAKDYTQVRLPLTKEQTKHIYDLAMKHELKALYKDVDGEHDVKTWSLAIKDAMDKIFN